MKRRRLRDRIWSTADRWGPSVTSIVTLLACLWYMRQLEGQNAALQAQMTDRSNMEIALRAEIQTWQAYVVGLKEVMIKAGIREVPPSPRPVTLRRQPGGQAEVTNRR